MTSQRGITARCHSAGSRSKRFPWATPLARAALLALTLPILGAISGCASESGLSRLDPTLNEIDLRRGKVAVLGVVKFEEPDQVRPPLVAMLERALREERRDIPLVPADSVRKRLGEERYRRILLDYEYQGTVGSTVLSEIADSLRGLARFLILARVEKDRTRSSTRGISSNDPGTGRAKYGMGITGRDARVAVHLYDLTRRALAVSAKYEGSSENSRPMLSPVQPGGGSGATVEIGQAVPPEEQGYPGIPDLALALEEPFRAFARSLPGAPAATSSSFPRRGPRP